MNPNRKWSLSIAAILSGNTAGLAHAAAAPELEADSDQIAEVTVTAQRRTESRQDVPITSQVMTAETRSQLSVETFDDSMRYLPNITAATTGPGQRAIYMRGLSTSLPGVQGSGGIGSFPNVAVYLDDQSSALPGRNLDIYAVGSRADRDPRRTAGNTLWFRCGGRRAALHHA